MKEDQKKVRNNQVEVLVFRKQHAMLADEWATIVTNGKQTKVFTTVSNTDYPSLNRAIAGLEAAGYSIDMERTSQW